MLTDEINNLMRDPKYAIASAMVDQTSIVFFVDEMTPEQADMPTVIDGREVMISAIE